VMGDTRPVSMIGHVAVVATVVLVIIAGQKTEEAEGSAERGRSAPGQLASAERWRADFAPGGPFASRWDEALPAIDAAYPDLDLTVQMGLVPIGPDPGSKLWEFWHVQSGEEPIRVEDGRLAMKESSGLVFVLLPGGRFWMGAQKRDPDGRNYASKAFADEGPVHEVELSAFFLSKYEMTQGQWERLAGSNPSCYQKQSVAPTLLHPVERVSWDDCMALLPDLSLTLPSEAQWEYGARGGTHTVWWTGDDRDSLRIAGAANLADQAAARMGATWETIEDWPELDDGYAVHAPVDEYAANAFGLHNVHGNECEWCLDGYDSGFYGRSPPRDPVSPHEGARYRVFRGGCFRRQAARTRSACRGQGLRTYADYDIGCRPARAIEP